MIIILKLKLTKFFFQNNFKYFLSFGIGPKFVLQFNQYLNLIMIIILIKMTTPVNPLLNIFLLL